MHSLYYLLTKFSLFIARIIYYKHCEKKNSGLIRVSFLTYQTHWDGKFQIMKTCVGAFFFPVKYWKQLNTNMTDIKHCLKKLWKKRSNILNHSVTPSKIVTIEHSLQSC